MTAEEFLKDETGVFTRGYVIHLMESYAQQLADEQSLRFAKWIFKTGVGCIPYDDRFFLRSGEGISSSELIAEFKNQDNE